MLKQVTVVRQVIKRDGTTYLCFTVVTVSDATLVVMSFAATSKPVHMVANPEQIGHMLRHYSSRIAYCRILNVVLSTQLCTPLAATTIAPSMLERPSLSFFKDSGISLPPCFFTCGANSRPTQPATMHTPSTAVAKHDSIRGPPPNDNASKAKHAAWG